jgi:putative salt-induced outer membrane protein
MLVECRAPFHGWQSGKKTAENRERGMLMRTGRYCGIVFVLMAVLPLWTAFAQAPAEPTPLYVGNVGGGLAITGGNTDTRNFNLTAAVVRDPKTRNVIKANASYLRGDQSDVLNLDRSFFNLRDEYTLSGRTFVFGQLDYLRDKFKEIIFFWAPTGGVGYKLVNSASTQFQLDGGAGGVLERNPGRASQRTGSLTSGQRFTHKFSDTAAISESLSSIWKTKDFADSLTNFSVGLTTTVVGNLQLKLEFIDSYKNKPANPSLKKNDTAFVTAFVLKF